MKHRYFRELTSHQFLMMKEDLNSLKFHFVRFCNNNKRTYALCSRKDEWDSVIGLTYRDEGFLQAFISSRCIRFDVMGTDFIDFAFDGKKDSTKAHWKRLLKAILPAFVDFAKRNY